ncbi:hypothetical protein QUF95_02955 [Paenibacillus silvae]|nr:hypothetical protein [Paenibacillus silvae]MDM5276321.1 hypothetical protein [Paenibacillus silvae]
MKLGKDDAIIVYCGSGGDGGRIMTAPIGTIHLENMKKTPLQA